MKLLRAILLGALLWVLIFFEVSILMFGFGLEDGIAYYLIHYIILIGFVVLVNLIYFRCEKVNGGLKEGLLLGIILVITGVVLDAVITVPLWIEESYAFFNNVYLWFGLIEIVVISAVVGILKR